jgi:hypothetical protein
MVIRSFKRPNFAGAKTWQEKLSRIEQGDIACATKAVSRDDTGMGYEVSLVLRSLQVGAKSEEETEVLLWYDHVPFLGTERTKEGGQAFEETEKRMNEIAAACVEAARKGST